MSHLTLYFDGGCTVNPGGIAVSSWVIYDEDQNLVTEGATIVADGAKASNNFAEWAALENALLRLYDHTVFSALPKSALPKLDVEFLSIKGDSRLVIKQLNGEWQVKAVHLKSSKDRCIELLELLGIPWTAEHISRELNEYTDQLGRLEVERYLKQKA